VAFKAAPDASITETETCLRAMLASIGGLPEISHTYGAIGAGDSGTVRQGVLYVKLAERHTRRHQDAVQQEVRQRLLTVPGIVFSIEEVGGVGSSVKPLNVNVKGEDMATLKRLAAELKAAMYRMPGIVDLEMTLEHDSPEYRLTVDRERAYETGIMTRDIVASVGKLVGGQVVSVYEDEEGDSIDVRVRLPENLRRDPEQVLDLKVIAGNGGQTLVPLRNVVRYEPAATPSEVNRRDLARIVTVSANLDGLPIGTAIQKINAATAQMAIPPGYSVSFAGEAEDMVESFGYMAEALVLAVLFVYLILAAQFESFLEPLAIMLSLPLSVVGMAGMLLATGDTVNIMSLIGLIMLMGLVTKNAILLVDYAKVLRSRGLDRRTAVIEAGRTRLRPIMMTTLAMIFGMLPLAFAIGSGAEMRAPMGRAVIGGLITSTMLTLLVVPVVYTVLDDIASWLKKTLLSRRAAKATSAALVILLTLSVSAATADAEARRLTLAEAVTIALSQNQEIVKAHEYGRSVQGRYLEERAAILPQLRMESEIARNRDETLALGDSDIALEQDQSRIGLLVSQPIYTWGKIGAAVRAAEKALKTAEERLRLARQSVEQQVTGSFYDLLLAKELHVLARQNRSQKERHLFEAERRFEAGVATDYDILAARVAVENASPEVIRTENDARIARDRLRFLLSIEEEVDADGALQGEGLSLAVLPSYEESLALAVNRRPELTDLRHQIGVFEELVTIARTGLKPRLDLQAGADWKDIEAGDAAADGYGYQAGIFFTWPLFDGRRTAGQVMQAESDLRTAQAEERRLIDAISLETREAVNRAREAEEIVRALSGTVTQAERLLAMAEKGYELGVKIRLEVEDAELNLLQAQSNLARAQDRKSVV